MRDPLVDENDMLDFDVPALGDIPPGVYTAEVVSVRIMEGKKAPYLSIQARLLNPEVAGRVVYDNVTLSPDPVARSLTKGTLEAIIGGALPSRVSKYELPDMLVGHQCTVVVTTQEYMGKARPEIVRWRRLESGEDTFSQAPLGDLPF